MPSLFPPIGHLCRLLGQGWKKNHWGGRGFCAVSLCSESWIFTLTLESSLAAAAESARAMPASISLLQGTLPHMYQQT